MRRTAFYAIAAIPIAVTIWFIVSSLIFVWIGNLQGQLEYPWLAYWTYWGDPDPTTRMLIIISGLVPTMAAIAICVITYRIAAGLRIRRRFPLWPWQRQREDDSPRPLERGHSDNHGHSRMASAVEMIDQFRKPSRHHGAKILGMVGRHLLYDSCLGRSGVSIEIAGTRGGKTSCLISTLAHWTGPQVVQDPSCEIGPMMWRHLLSKGRRVYIINPDPNPANEDGEVAPWAHLIARYNPIGWIDPTKLGASSHIRTVARHFIDDDGVKIDGTAMFFRNAARDMISCILAHIIWHQGPNAPPKTLPALQAVLTLEHDNLIQYLISIRNTSRSSMARDLAGPAIKEAEKGEKTFNNIRTEIIQATAWLSDPEMRDMVSGEDFDVSCILGREPATVISQIPMDTLLNYPSLARVIFGSFISAKIASGTKTKTLFLPDEAWLLGRMSALKIALFAGGKHGLALHLPWQSMGQIEEIWGAAGRKFWLDNCAYIAVSSIRDPIVAKEVSDMCGTMAVVAYSEGDNQGTQGGTGLFARLSRGRNTNRHEIKRSIMMLAEVIADLARDDLLILGLRHPAIIKRALWWRVPALADVIDPSPYQEEEEDEAA